MRPRRILSVATVIVAAFAFAGGSISAQQPACLPGIGTALQGPHAAAYTLVRNTLTPTLSQLANRLTGAVDQTTYQTLLTLSHTIANSIPNGRLLLSLPDGTVVVDTGKPDDPTNGLPQGNSYQHYQDKTVNENHNSRVAIISAQQYPCGLGVESKLSSTTGFVESYVAQRLGTHLDSIGTVRLSTR
ncbi:MAG: hypothetical protein ABI693_12055 [Bryobacteraceae bacterium]